MPKSVLCPVVGESVIYHDARGRAYTALVLAVWSHTCVNVVFVSMDVEKQDSYGRQIKRQTSVVHKTLQPAHGNYWRFPDEEPNPVIPPDQA